MDDDGIDTGIPDVSDLTFDQIFALDQAGDPTIRRAIERLLADLESRGRLQQRYPTPPGECPNC